MSAATTVLLLRKWERLSPPLRLCRLGAGRLFGHSARLRDGRDLRVTGLAEEKGMRKYASIRDHYDTPKNPLVLAHGLLGFAELKLGGAYLPAIQYWHGIRTALSAQGTTVITASVPPSGSIQQRAAKLAQAIAEQAPGKSVNIIAHSMGGLDARYMISKLQPSGVDVKALVTVATPHHGTALADYLIDHIGPKRLPRLYTLWERATGWEAAAFAQLTKRYMDEFNASTPDAPGVRYFSYGAMIGRPPPLLSPFRLSHGLLETLDGPNDGLVSVHSSRWGQYKGTLVGVNHLDLINWSNRLRYAVQKLVWGQQNPFNAVAFYLDISDMLAKEGL
ncbi:alpha/beta-hydrolase [Thozetella sp. PMI_491]|nr:alpha/beta-hydrolase [Thozetella sp. PMI_491]